MERRIVRLLPGREKPLRQGHPWLFSGAIESEEGPEDAPLADVLAAGGEWVGAGFYSRRSQIRVRMMGEGAREADRGFFDSRLAAAAELRAQVVPSDTTGYRLVNSEGDGVPGWTVDRFGDVLVSQITATGLEAVRETAYEALAAAVPGAAILQSNRLPARRAEGLSEEDETILGETPADAVFAENNLQFSADLRTGQKTGFYCDQRESRRLAERLAGGSMVLDLFAHSGAFGIYALRGGAAAVTHVESSAVLVERGRGHYARNGLPVERGEWVEENVFEFLRREKRAYGLIVCDPPPLARRRADLNKAARAYKDLNRLAFERLAPGGFLLTFSCSGAVDGKLFRQILFAAATEAGVRAQLLQPLAAGPDHPVSIAHPEGEYLKGWLVRRVG